MNDARFLLFSLAILAAGCGDGFPDEEMHLGIEDKVRPYAVVLDPPETAPGGLVRVTFLAQAPDPDEVDVTWRVAQDYHRGLYGADVVERSYLDIDAPLPTSDDDGFMSQVFYWTVPDSILLLTSAIPDLLTDPPMVALAERLVPEAGSPPRKAIVDDWLTNLSRFDFEDFDEDTQRAVLDLADRFACQVRFRARLRTDITVDVTRTLTVRHTRRFYGPNTNENPFVTDFTVVALDKRDADRDDIWDEGVTRELYYFAEHEWGRPPRADVPLRDGWTYFAMVLWQPQSYTSPFDYDGYLLERSWYRWYYYRQDAPGSAHQFFLTEGGEEAEMWHLDWVPRLAPAGVGSRFRLAAVVRDERPEWKSYHASYGATVEDGIVEFVAP